ncbi:Gfo/Idh/MocA family protein [Salinispira pacifica]
MIEGSRTGTAVTSLTYGMVGGGEGALIGDVHRKAINFDTSARLVAGCFSRSFANTRRTGELLGLASDRLYKDYRAMAQAEARRPDTIDFVVIVTPNSTHFPIAKAFLEQGIHVVCDKPLVLSTAEAKELSALAKRKRLLFCVTYTYTGYPAVKQARALIADGELGDIRFVAAEYIQEWLATPAERAGNKQAEWRTDPKQSGLSNSVGDIGTHAENMVSYMTGLKIDSLCARMDTFVKGRRLDDNATIMLNFKGGAKGSIWVSQVAAGYDNGLRIRVVGSKGSLEWAQEDPNYIVVRKLDAPRQIISRGREPFAAEAARYNRVPAGHPEGYFEAFANVYRAFCEALSRVKAGEKLTAEQLEYPGLPDGAQGVLFIEKCVESSKAGATWVKFA